MNTKSITILCVMMIAVIVIMTIPDVKASHPQEDNYPVIKWFTSTDNSITISWHQERINPSSEYAVYWKHGNDSTWNRDSIPTGQLHHTITGLDSATMYYAKVIPVINGDDRLFPTHTATLSTMPLPVTNIQASVVNGKILHITWDSIDRPHIVHNVFVSDETHGHEFMWYATSTGADIPLGDFHNGDQLRIKAVVKFDYHEAYTYHYITTLFGKH